MPKRTFWLVTGVAIGAGSSVWAERRVRRGLQEAASRLQPDALVMTAGRGARQAAASAGRGARVGARVAGVRMRQAVTEGRGAMERRQEELWTELADRNGGPAAILPAGAGPRGVVRPAR